MDYEKAYKEALERARSGMQIDEVFPELKESEDERIRKELLNHCYQCSKQRTTVVNIEDYNRWIAWLEKQKYEYEVFEPIESTLEYKEGFKAGVESERQKEPHYIKRNALFDKCVENCDPEVMKSVSDKIDEILEKEQQPAEFTHHETNESLKDAVTHQMEDDGDVDDFVRKGIDDIVLKYAKLGAKWQKEQKPAEWSEDCREDDLRTRFAFYTYKDEDSVLYLSNVFVEEASRNKGFGTKILAAAEKVAETLGANAIRLKVKQNSPANAWYRKHGYGYMAFEGDYDWLEKTLEYLKPKKKEWSEEDVRNLYNVIYAVREAYKNNDEYKKNLTTWLKSLRPQPHWKPSDEQMTILERIVNDIKTKFTGATVKEQLTLESLFNDLKKL